MSSYVVCITKEEARLVVQARLNELQERIGLLNDMLEYGASETIAAELDGMLSLLVTAKTLHEDVIAQIKRKEEKAQ